MEFLIYVGVAVNVVGALMLLAFGIRYMMAIRRAERMPIREAQLKADWGRWHNIGFGLIIGGASLACIAALAST